MIRLLDLFCGAGGAAMGYYRAGFTDITGIDIKPMPRYPFKFIQADALEYLAEHGHEYDVIHASPPCQRYSIGTQRWKPEDYPDLITDLRKALIKSKKLWIIENVTRAPLNKNISITLCGQMFGLHIIRHRAFEIYPFLLSGLIHPKHPKRGDFVTCAGHGGNGSNSYKVWCKAMNIDWMNKTELAQAIPPAYTEFIGKQLMRVLYDLQ